MLPTKHTLCLAGISELLDLQKCPKLEELALACCSITALSDLGTLRALRVLNISCCYALLAVPDSIGSCSNLETLHLRDSGLSSLPSSVCSLEQLIYGFDTGVLHPMFNRGRVPSDFMLLNTAM